MNGLEYAGIWSGAFALCSLVCVRWAGIREAEGLRSGRVPSLDAHDDADQVEAASRLPLWLVSVAYVVGFVAAWRSPTHAALAAAIGVVLVVSVYTDLRSYRIYDVLVALVALTAIVSMIGGPWPRVFSGFAGAAAFAGPLVAADMLVPGVRFSGGDVKLAAALGLALGFVGAFVALEVVLVLPLLYRFVSRLAGAPVAASRGAAFAPWFAAGSAVAFVLPMGAL